MASAKTTPGGIDVSGRPQRHCDRCTAVDDGPRCVVDDGTQDGALFHLDCHAELDPDGGCHQHPGVGVVKDHDLLDHIVLGKKVR